MEQSGLFYAEPDLKTFAGFVVSVQINADTRPAAFTGIGYVSCGSFAIPDSKIAVWNSDGNPGNMTTCHRPFLIVFNGNVAVRMRGKPYFIVIYFVGTRVACPAHARHNK